MYFAKDSEYNDIREKSFCQWLDEMEKHAVLDFPLCRRFVALGDDLLPQR